MDEIERIEEDLYPDRAVRRFLGQVTPEDVEDARETAELLEFARTERRELEWAEAEERAAQASGENARVAHRARAFELERVGRKLDSSAKGHLALAAGLVEGRENERLPDEEYARFHKAARRFADEADLRAKLRKLERREQAAAKVTREPGPYDDATSPHSWVRDVLIHMDPQAALLDLRSSGLSDMRPEAVAERLCQHGRDVHRALLKRSRYGRTVERMMRESRRREDVVEHERLFRQDLNAARFAEIRSLTTGGGTTASASGGGAAAFVPPAFVMARWAEFRSPYRAFADQLDNSVPLPDYGMDVYLPIVTAGTSVTTQTELSGVSEGDPTTSFSSSPILPKVGQITVSEQWLDRAGPGISGDVVLFQQLREQLDAQVDAYAITQALANAQTVTNSGSFSLANATAGVGGFLGDLKKAKSKLTDLAGTRIRATHCFAPDDFVDYIGAYSDGNARPVFSPELDDNRLPIRSAGDQNAEGYSGYVLVGLALFADSNIPLSGSNTQIIVCRADTILLLEGAPMPYLYPPTYAGNLDALLGIRAYVATIPRYPSGVAVIGGSAYTASTFA